ncbi:MAG: tryptophan--tRNA ligase, partial [Firmicutes bacterium]|nr:tryptophan--tRNA ligase [Bacillota bacterium]
AFRFQEIFNPSELSGIEAACRTAEIGCVQCKELLTRKLVETMAPLHEKRRSLEERPAYLEEILVEGEKQARKKARATLEAVRGAMGL